MSCTGSSNLKSGFQQRSRSGGKTYPPRPKRNARGSSDGQNRSLPRRHSSLTTATALPRTTNIWQPHSYIPAPCTRAPSRSISSNCQANVSHIQLSSKHAANYSRIPRPNHLQWRPQHDLLLTWKPNTAYSDDRHTNASFWSSGVQIFLKD